MFGDHGNDISAEMGKELDYLTKLYLVKAFNVRKIVLENQSFKREASKSKSSDKYNCLPIETRQLLYIDRLLLDNTFPNSLCLTAFIDLGLDHYVQSAIDIEVFRAFYGQAVRQSEFGKVLSKSSLSMYNNCRVSMGKQLYLLIDLTKNICPYIFI
jgi:hypothetical protein